MKKIILLIIIGLSLVGCCSTTDGKAYEVSDAVCLLSYNGHQYIMFGSVGVEFSVVHDPDCPKCKKMKLYE